MHSTSGIFQKELKKRVAHIPFFKVRSNDIPIHSKNHKDHLENLRKVLHIIQENGLPLKLGKYVFMVVEVIYLGFKSNKNDVTPVKETIENIRTTKETRNVSGLKLFLGLINYDHHYFENFSEI